MRTKKSRTLKEAFKYFKLHKGDKTLRELAEEFAERYPDLVEGYKFESIRSIFKRISAGDYEQELRDVPDLDGDLDLGLYIDIPASWAEFKGPYHIKGIDKLGIISDLHLPYHDVPAIQAALYHLKKQKINGLLINGDFMDFKSICHHKSGERLGTATLQEELKVGRSCLEQIRNFFPGIPIIFKEGNHEVWLTRYINNVPQLATIEGVSIQDQLKLRDFDIEFVPDWQKMTYGKLNIIHGHEVRASGKTPAKNLWDKCFDNVLCGHVHRQHEYSVKRIDGQIYGCWTTGCLSDLYPYYAGAAPQAEHGCAIVDLEQGGDFRVRLQRIINGRLI